MSFAPHCSQPSARSLRRRALVGFSLIELLVVVGLIVVLVGVVSFALSGRGSEGVALANAQSILSGLVTSTRSQAALHQTNARLIVYATVPSGTVGDANKYLRMLQVVRLEGSNWVAVGGPVTLPGSICVVPVSPVPATHLATGVTWNNNATTGPVSTLSTATGFSTIGQSVVAGGRTTAQYFGTTGSGRIFYLEFDSTGTVVSNLTSNPTRIALTTAVTEPSVPPKFNNANRVRGLFIRKSGAISLVNDATSF